MSHSWVNHVHLFEDVDLMPLVLRQLPTLAEEVKVCAMLSKAVRKSVGKAYMQEKFHDIDKQQHNLWIWFPALRREAQMLLFHSKNYASLSVEGIILRKEYYEVDKLFASGVRQWGGSSS